MDDREKIKTRAITVLQQREELRKLNKAIARRNHRIEVLKKTIAVKEEMLTDAWIALEKAHLANIPTLPDEIARVIVEETADGS